MGRSRIGYFITAVSAVLLMIGDHGSAATSAKVTASATPDVAEIVNRMYAADDLRNARMMQYSSLRTYVAENKRFNKRAAVEVSECFTASTGKKFVTLSEEGSGFIRNRVIYKLIEAESEAFVSDKRKQTRFSHENYKFRLLGTEELDGRPAFVLEVKPHEPEKYLIEGKIWVDQDDFAIVQIDGSPAKRPSFWTRSVHLIRKYGRVGGLWLPAWTRSESNVLIAGKSTLEIQYRDYEVQLAGDTEVASGVKCPVSREGE